VGNAFHLDCIGGVSWVQSSQLCSQTCKSAFHDFSYKIVMMKNVQLFHSATSTRRRFFMDHSRTPQLMDKTQQACMVLLIELVLYLIRRKDIRVIYFDVFVVGSLFHDIDYVYPDLRLFASVQTDGDGSNCHCSSTDQIKKSVSYRYF
jgi:hypothetical protein